MQKAQLAALAPRQGRGGQDDYLRSPEPGGLHRSPRTGPYRIVDYGVTILNFGNDAW